MKFELAYSPAGTNCEILRWFLEKTRIYIFFLECVFRVKKFDECLIIDVYAGSWTQVTLLFILSYFVPKILYRKLNRYLTWSFLLFSHSKISKLVYIRSINMGFAFFIIRSNCCQTFTFFKQALLKWIEPFLFCVVQR